MQGPQAPPSLAKNLPNNDMSQACKDVLPSLPPGEDWLAASLKMYQGFWLLPSALSGTLACQNHFQALSSDILLASNPKSGTTWLMAILFALLNRANFSDSDSQACHPLLTQNPHDLVPYLEVPSQQENPNLTAFTSPRLLATHLPYLSLPQSVKDSECKLIYLCRNPKDTFVSLWHFINKVNPEKGQVPLAECLDNFCRGMSIYGPYWDHVLSYHRASLEMPKKVLFMTYEDMKQDPGAHARRLADFIGCPFSKEELRDGIVERILKMCSFDNLSTLEVNKSGKSSTRIENKVYFRRGEVGDWVNHMSAEMGERIDRIMEEKLRGSGLKL